jgi:hypothetical protein
MSPQAVSEALSALRAAEAEAEAARKAAQAAVLKADVELERVLDEEEQQQRRDHWASQQQRKMKRGKVATACATLCMLCWIFLMLVSILVGTGFDHYTVNEVDYWYPVRLCRRGAGGQTPTFDEFNASLQASPPSQENLPAPGQPRLTLRTRRPSDSARTPYAPAGWHGRTRLQGRHPTHPV